MIMKKIRQFAALVLIAAVGAASAADAPESWDGLVEVQAKKMDAVFLLPGADFRPYTKVMIDPTQVAFHKDWMRSMNQTQRDLSRRVTQEDADRILSAARSNFDDIFGEAFTKAGIDVVTAPGPDVLRVSTAVVNLYVNAPDIPTAGRSYTFTAEAGEATLIIETRDSMTGALMGRVVDRRETRGTTGMQMTTSATNVSEFRALFKQWAGITVKGIDELKAHSPVPTDLKPKQKL
jgi:hypothetical protein